MSDEKRRRQKYEAFESEIASLKARVRELEKDAARLDWCDRQWLNPIHIEVEAEGDPTRFVERCVTLFSGSRDWSTGNIRATIDAAMSAPTPKAEV